MNIYLIEVGSAISLYGIIHAFITRKLGKKLASVEMRVAAIETKAVTETSAEFAKVEKDVVRVESVVPAIRQACTLCGRLIKSVDGKLECLDHVICAHFAALRGK
jgi:hypothetical protein